LKFNYVRKPFNQKEYCGGYEIEESDLPNLEDKVKKEITDAMEESCFDDAMAKYLYLKNYQ